MANASQPHEPAVEPSVPQGDMPGAYTSNAPSRPITRPPHHVRTVALAIGLAILAVIVVALAVRDDDPNPPVNPEGDVPLEPRR